MLDYGNGHAIFVVVVGGFVLLALWHHNGIGSSRSVGLLDTSRLPVYWYLLSSIAGELVIEK